VKKDSVDKGYLSIPVQTGLRRGLHSLQKGMAIPEDKKKYPGDTECFYGNTIGRNKKH